MAERDAVFREKLISMMATLNAGEAKDAYLIGMVGSFARQAAKSTGAKDWTDLKERVDMGTYDKLLNAFQHQSADFAKDGDTRSVRALEVLAISLIARHQSQPDLKAGVRFLDEFIDNCAAAVKQADTSEDPPPKLH
ncbi:MAG: hypothetical protein ABIQ30_09470 [Devosia sp.]